MVLASRRSHVFWISILVCQTVSGSALDTEVDLTSSRSFSARGSVLFATFDIMTGILEVDLRKDEESPVHHHQATSRNI